MTLPQALNKKIHKRAGFTIIELLVTVVVVLVLSGIAANQLANFTNRNAFDVTQRQLIAAFRKAQMYAMTSRNNDSWGLYIYINQVTLFKGSTWPPADPSYNEKISIPENVILNDVSQSPVFTIFFTQADGYAWTPDNFLPTETISLVDQQTNVSTPILTITGPGAVYKN